ncbi:MAG: class I SAM-dependent DNA methyltransferase [Candidatus Heimdallarchaeota archaeon]
MSLFNPQDYYRILSNYWDRLYKDQVPYQQAFEFIDELREKEALPKAVADVSCGTGLLLQNFEKNGYEIIGSDLSSEMLKHAELKLHRKTLFQGSYHNILLPKSFPLIVSFFNSFAYCLDPQTLSKVLGHLKSQLMPQGLIVFDLFVTEQPEEVFLVKSFSFDDGVHISRTFLGYPETNKTFRSHFVFTVFENRQLQTYAAESRRGLFSETDVRKAIEAAELDIYYVGVGPGHPEHSGSTTFVVQQAK